MNLLPDKEPKQKDKFSFIGWLIGIIEMLFMLAIVGGWIWFIIWLGGKILKAL